MPDTRGAKGKPPFVHSLAPILLIFCLFLLSHDSPGSSQRILIQSTDPETRLNWFKDHLAMKQESLFRDLEWEFIGPDIFSGRITDVAVHRDHKRRIFVASASGGVWRTANAGTTWEPLLENAPSASVGDVTVAPSNPNIVWVGLGEANILRSSLSGAGVFRSLDGGNTWEYRGLAGTHTIPRIIIHPKDPDIVYVAASGHEWTDNAERGVYKTSDGGLSWDKVLYVDERSGAIDLVMDPGDSDTLYAATWQRIRRRWSDPQTKPGYSGSGIHRTTDGGKSWAPINHGLPAAHLRGRIGIDVSRSNPDVLYALLRNHTPRPSTSKEWDPDFKAAEASRQEVIGAEVYRSDDRGQSWRKVGPPYEVLCPLLMYPNINWFGWVFGQIRVDPNDEDTVYLLGVNLLRSTDGGRSFEKITYPGLHVDHHALWIDPDDSSYLVNGNDGGVNISYDGGATWMNFHHNLPVQQFYSVAVDVQDPFYVYGSPQDHGCFRGPITCRPGRGRPGQDYRPMWESVPGGEYQVVAVDPSDPTVYYCGNLTRSVFMDGRWESVSTRPERKKGEPAYRSQSLTPFILSPHNPTVIYLGLQYLCRSLDSGGTWEKISPDLTYFNPEQQGDVSFATITSISESPLKFGLIYVGTDDGRVHVTRDGGNAWTEISAGLPYNKHVSRLTASAFDRATVYISLNGMRDDDFADYLYKSTDYGSTWVDISGNLPGGPINVVREDPKSAGLLYVGIDLGVYVTTDGGRSWHVLGGNLPTVFVHDLVVHPRDRMVVIATHGRGMWALDVSSLGE